MSCPSPLRGPPAACGSPGSSLHQVHNVTNLRLHTTNAIGLSHEHGCMLTVYLYSYGLVGGGGGRWRAISLSLTHIPTIHAQTLSFSLSLALSLSPQVSSVMEPCGPAAGVQLCSPPEDRHSMRRGVYNYYYSINQLQQTTATISSAGKQAGEHADGLSESRCWHACRRNATPQPLSPPQHC